MALIQERIEQAFAFLQDVLKDPSITEIVPDGSEMRFQEVVTGETTFHLVAYRSEAASEVLWAARVITPAQFASEHHAITRPQVVTDLGGNPVTRPEVGDTAEEALEALSAKLFAAQPRLREISINSRRTA